MQMKDQRSCAYILCGVEKVKVMKSGLSHFHSFEIKKKMGPTRMSGSNPETEIRIRNSRFLSTNKIPTEKCNVLSKQSKTRAGSGRFIISLLPPTQNIIATLVFL